jgi:tetratricopeptide (TPR) repeat protein
LRLSHRAGKKAINATVNPALRKELAGLVAAGNPEATDVQAEIEMNEGHTARAIELSEKVVRSDGDEYSKRSAWGRLGHLREEKKDLSGAQAALWIGAQEYDNPRAYLNLAERYMKPDDKNRIPFMQKAAASGEQEAINLLAIEYMQYYLDAKREGIEKRATSKKMLQLAEEWLLVYVEGPPLKVRSHAYTLLGLLYCERGEVDKGIKISSMALQHAEEVGEEDPKVPYSLKWKWEDISDRLTLWVQILDYARESSYRR